MSTVRPANQTRRPASERSGASSDRPKSRSPNGSPRSDRGSVRHLLHDFLELGELQVGLVKADALEAWKASRRSVVALAAAVVLGLGSVPVLLGGVGLAIAEASELSAAAALIIVSLIAGVLPAVGLSWFSLTRLRSAGRSFARSSNELAENLHCLRNTLKTSSGSQS